MSIHFASWDFVAGSFQNKHVHTLNLHVDVSDAHHMVLKSLHWVEFCSCHALAHIIRRFVRLCVLVSVIVPKEESKFMSTVFIDPDLYRNFGCIGITMFCIYWEWEFNEISIPRFQEMNKRMNEWKNSSHRRQNDRTHYMCCKFRFFHNINIDFTCST